MSTHTIIIRVVYRLFSLCKQHLPSSWSRVKEVHWRAQNRQKKCRMLCFRSLFFFCKGKILFSTLRTYNKIKFSFENNARILHEPCEESFLNFIELIFFSIPPTLSRVFFHPTCLSFSGKRKFSHNNDHIKNDRTVF